MAELHDLTTIIGVTFTGLRVLGPDPPGFRWRSLAFRTAWQQSLSWQWKLFGWWEGGQSFYHLCCLVFFKISIGLKIGVFTMKTLNDFNKKTCLENIYQTTKVGYPIYTLHTPLTLAPRHWRVALELPRSCRYCDSAVKNVDPVSQNPTPRAMWSKSFPLSMQCGLWMKGTFGVAFLGCGFKTEWCVCLHFCYQLPLHFLKLEAVTLASHPKTSQGTTTWILKKSKPIHTFMLFFW